MLSKSQESRQQMLTEAFNANQGQDLGPHLCALIAGSNMTDEELTDLSNKIGRIPTARKWEGRHA